MVVVTWLGETWCLLAGDQIVQRHIEVPAQGGQVVQVGPGGPCLPFLPLPDGIPPKRSASPSWGQTGLLSQLIEPLLKIHGKDLLFASVRGHTGTGPHPFCRKKDSKKGPQRNQKWDTI